MNETPRTHGQRTLILAPRGRDALVASGILREARLEAHVCMALGELIKEIKQGADVAIVTEEATRDSKMIELRGWVAQQPPWSDFPFVLLTEHGGGLERNPSAAQLMEWLGNVTFLERPFHPTTLVSVIQASLRGRRRQYECERLNAELESRVIERTAELAAANRQLLSQIEERERVESTLRQMQRLEAIGQLTSGVAHDFNNLLTVVLGNIGFLEKGLEADGIDGKLAQRLRYMRIAAERGAKLTDQLLSFSRRQRLDPRALDLNETVAGMRDLLQSTIGGSIRIDTELQEDLWLALVDPTRLELAILNLAINARDAMEVGGTLRVETRNVTVGPPRWSEEPPAGDYVGIFVNDDGAGMPANVRAKVFEPFFTTKEVGKGSGLGLSQVLGFAKQSGGGVCIESHIGKGTSVGIFLPRTEAEIATPVSTAPDAYAESIGRGGNILVVDDDHAVREVTAGMLREFDYVVFEAGSGGAALDILECAPDIDLMIVDFAMPGINGAELARLARAKYPVLPILFVTGFADRAAMTGVSEADIIGKPFVDSELTRRVQETLNASRSRTIVPLRRSRGN